MINSRTDKFVKEVVKMRPIDFYGVATLLTIPLAEQDKARDTMVIFDEMITKFESLTTEKQKEIIKLCKQANKNSRGVKNGNRTKTANSQEENLPNENV